MSRQPNAYILARNVEGGTVEYLQAMHPAAATWTADKAAALTFPTLPKVDGAARRYRARYDAEQVMYITEP